MQTNRSRGAHVLMDLHSLIDEMGKTLEGVMSQAASEVEAVRKWSREQTVSGDDAGRGNADGFKMAKEVAETLIRIGRATGAAQRIASEAECLELMAISTAGDLWPAFNVNATTTEESAT